jgi:D-psicose/D-tagatose/L-ribulose 3-epimerase
MNKIGMNLLLWGVDIDASHIPLLEPSRRAGFDGVEIPVLGQPRAELEKLRGAAESLGLECTAVTFITPDTNPIDPDPEIRALAVPNLERRIDECAALGSDLLAGGIYQAHKVFAGRAATREEWTWSADYLREAGEYAAERGVRLGLEFLNRFEVYLINTAADAARMAKDVGLDNVGVLYDTHHANIEDPDPGTALGSIRDELIHVHISESHRGTLGTGQVNWDANFAALRAIDYSGWLVVEAFGTRDPRLVSAANVWRNAFESEEQLTEDAARFIRDALAPQA